MIACTFCMFMRNNFCDSLIAIYSLFSGYDKGELDILEKSSYSRGFEFFLSIFQPEL